MSSEGQDFELEPRRPEGDSPGQPPHRARVFEGPDESFSCVVCARTGDPGEFLECPFHDEDASTPAVCGHCYSRPKAKIGDLALVQKAGLQAGLSLPLSKTFGSGSRPVHDGEELIGHVSYAPEKIPEKRFDTRAGFICARHAKQGCYYAEGEAVFSDAAPLDSAERMDDLLEMVGAPQDLKVGALPPGGLELQRAMGVQSLLDLLGVDETDFERRDTFRDAVSDGVLSSEALKLAVFHLRWNLNSSQFESPYASGDEWHQYSLALQELLVDRTEPPSPTGVPVSVELEKFRARSVIWMQTPQGLVRLADAAASLSDGARTVLTVAGYSIESRRFGAGGHAATANSLERLRVLLASPSETVSAARVPAARAPPATPADNNLQISQDLKDLGLDPELLQKRSFQESALAARRREVAPLQRDTPAAFGPPFGRPAGGDQRLAGVARLEGDAHGSDALEALRLKDMFSRVLVDSDKINCSGDAPPQAAISLLENRALLKHSINARNNTPRILLSDGDEDSATLPGGIYLSPSGPPLAANITFMQNISAEQLKIYFKVTEAHIRRTEECDDGPLLSLWRRVQQFVKGRSAADMYSQFQVMAPKPPATELSHLLALGRLYYVRGQVLLPAPTDQSLTLAKLVSKLEAHCRHQESLGVPQQRAALQLFGLMGFTRAAKAAQLPAIAGLASGHAAAGVPPLMSDASVAAADSIKAKALTSAWVGVNSTKACSNCAGSHQLARCPALRRVDLPCQLCYGLRGTHHERDCGGAPQLDAAGQAEYSRLRYLFWAAKNGADATSPSGVVDVSSGNC
jgi:hypothetical protein